MPAFTYPVGTTIDRFIAQRQNEFRHATGELSQLLRDIILASKIISREINRAGLSGIEGMTEEENVQGEKQRMLDVIADVRFTRALINGQQVCAILAEESEGIIDTGNMDAKYVVAIDPLDGSSNIDVNISVGTIFSIYKRTTKPGENFLSHPNIIQPEKGEYYSINENQSDSFPKEVRDYILSCKAQGKSTRYVGSLVCDFHRNLLKGGIYLYPSTSTYSNGKLRLLYECNALAMISEQANGMAMDGTKRILEIVPEWYHQRVPFYAGSKQMVEHLNSL